MNLDSKSRVAAVEDQKVDVTHQVEQAISNVLIDPLQIPSGPITWAQAKRFKEALNGLILDMWAKQMGQESSIDKKELTMIQATINVKDQAIEEFWGEDNAN